MAFNFNWSPLIADTSRARDMLTTALNKSPKPPIIVDDIIVTELNLGGEPPDLEILEIGDLAEDKFRGIFKMSYTGDAFLTLRTRVQANPLNTYLSTKPSFASPQPLAAASGLTIPLQITLSDIRLSGFVILVFSQQKGITLVFRNDPLESLKVSSTFDSIPFVRDYLQKEIEGQLRVLFMDDLPAIIHRLSLRIWSSEYQRQEAEASRDAELNAEIPINPLSSPPQTAFDDFGRPIEERDISLLTADNDSQTHASHFSQRNLLRLATLNDSHNTLSLFTPTVRDSIYRAWAGAAEKGEAPNISPFGFSHHASARAESTSAASSISGSSAPASHYSFSDAGSIPSRSSRPTLSTMSSTYSFNSSGGATRGRGPARKRRHRVVNLRKQEDPPAEQIKDTSPAVAGSHGSRPSTPTSTNGSSRDAAASHSSEREGELDTPPDSPEQKHKDQTTPHARVRLLDPRAERPEVLSPRPRAPASATKLQQIMRDAPSEMREVPQREHREQSQADEDPLEQQSTSGTPDEFGPTGTVKKLPRRPQYLSESSRTQSLPPGKMPLRTSRSSSGSSTAQTLAGQMSVGSLPGREGGGAGPGAREGGSILEQAWMMKMANEIARRVENERGAGVGGVGGESAGHGARWKSGFWDEEGVAGRKGAGGVSAEELEDRRAPPPAYAA